MLKLKPLLRGAFAAPFTLVLLSLTACGSADSDAPSTGDQDAAADAAPPPTDAARGDHADAWGHPGPADAGAAPDAADAADADAADAGCMGDDGCPLGSLCASGACVPGCTATHRCAGASTCCAGQCRDLSTDPDHCGACGQACATNGIATPVCAAGVCSGACASGFADCNHDLLGDGCETNIGSDPAHCGGCGVVCSSENVTPACANGVCDGACAPGFADCDGDKRKDGCETNILGDTSSCGACGAVCSTSHVPSVSCSGGACKGACESGWMDCNANLAKDGCETNVAGDPGNCGACGSACSSNHMASLTCASGTCGGSCAWGWDDCNGDKGKDGCETKTHGSDRANCGACGAACANTCISGACVCRPGLPDAPVLPTRNVKAAITIAAADFNGDGLLDLAQGSMQPAPGGGYSVRVFLNQGGGIFTWKDYPTHAGAIAMIAWGGDIVTADYDDQSVEILGNDGQGNFGPASRIVVGNSPVDLAPVNGELIIVDEYSSTLRTLAGPMSPGTPTGKTPIAIASGDLDGDRRDDMVVVNLDEGTVSVFASASGNARTDYPAGTYPLSVALADLDGDGDKDVIVGERGTPALHVLLNQGNGKLGAGTTYPTGQAWPMHIATADFNEDGHLDVVTANDFAGSAVTVFLNAGNGTLEAGVGHAMSNAPPSGTGLAVGDFVGRGHADIATAGSSTSAVYFFLGDGTGHVIRPPTVPTGGGSVAVAIGDVDADGVLDLVGANYEDGTVSVITGGGGRTFHPKVDVPLAGTAEPMDVALADLNGDGLLDVVTTSAFGSIYVLLNTKGKPGTFSPPTTYSAPTFGSVLYGLSVGDVDGDGDLDVAAANYKMSIALFFNDGHGGFAKEVDVSTGTTEEPNDVKLIDLNGDHLLDMAVGAQDILVLLNKGGGVFDAPSVHAVSGLVQSMATGDLDGDGRPDLVAVGNVNYSSDGYVDVLMNGASGLGAAASYGMTDLPGSVLVTDFDRDGRLDVVAASQNDNRGVVSVFPNTGGGTLGTRIDYSTPLGAKGLAARDLDGDGHTDVVATVDYNGGSGMYLLYGRCL